MRWRACAGVAGAGCVNSICCCWLMLSRITARLRQPDQSAFCQLLTMPDPDILALLTGRMVADDEPLRNVIERLLERP